MLEKIADYINRLLGITDEKSIRYLLVLITISLIGLLVKYLEHIVFSTKSRLLKFVLNLNTDKLRCFKYLSLLSLPESDNHC